MSKKFAVDLYFDVISPYSFILFEVSDQRKSLVLNLSNSQLLSLHAYRAQWPKMDVTLKPVALGHVMKAAGNKPPALAVAAKGPYMMKDVQRLARYFDLPLQFREDFITIIQTKSSINADRLICAVQMTQPEKTEAVARAHFRRFWCERKDIFETADFVEVLTSCGVANPATLVASITSEPVKERIRQYTEEAIDGGCFGAPWTVLTLEDGSQEHFFGSDRLHMIGHLMGEKFTGPVSCKL
ncbi:gstk-1 [Pristionchus pacificus]|uniref:Glutathione S-transferase kappa n=1 Tax=Pristionchus pacificus TaxID=54126 RepID=A0A2A6B9S5_PRIPA|nr:gstk-1 [Pristionchus pacificus]|eukprot:PDM62630.1 gstk-1 [Pristionchus pacificus]